LKKVFSRIALLFGLTLFLFALDFFSKWATVQFIEPIGLLSSRYPFGGIALFHDFFGIDFSLNYAVNKGAAWGVLSSFQKPLLIFRMVVVAGLIGLLVFVKQGLSKQIPLVLIIAGAVGNIVDYFLYGHVIDMFHFIFWGYSFPIFNVADSCIFCGIAWLLLDSFFQKSKKK
jgi:signal peptidase II